MPSAHLCHPSTGLLSPAIAEIPCRILITPTRGSPIPEGQCGEEPSLASWLFCLCWGAGEGVRETCVGSQAPALLLHTLIARQSLVSHYPGAPPGCQSPAANPRPVFVPKSPSLVKTISVISLVVQCLRIRLMQVVTGSIPDGGRCHMPWKN